MSNEMKVRQFFFVDKNPRGKSLDEYHLMFGPDTDGEGVELYQCAESSHFDKAAVLLVLERGDAVKVANGKFHQAFRCQLVHEVEVKKADADELEDMEVVQIPDRLMGVQLPEVEGIDYNRMAAFNASLNLSRALETDGEERPSIWERLGRRLGRLF